MQEKLLDHFHCDESGDLDPLVKVRGIRDLMQETKQCLRSDLPKLYSLDLLNNLFRHPYTKR